MYYTSQINQTRIMYMSNVMICTVQITTSAHTVVSKRFKEHYCWGLASCRKLPQRSQTSGCTAFASWPGLSFSSSSPLGRPGLDTQQNRGRERGVIPPHLGQTIYLNFTKGSVGGSYNNVAMATITAPGLKTYLWRLSSDLAGTSQGAVNFTCGERNREQALNDATRPRAVSTK